MKRLRHEDLQLRKLMLLQRSAVQRQMLAIQARQIMAPAVRVADRVRAGGQWVRAHPALVAGAAALMLAWRPKAVLGLAARSLGLSRWQTFRTVTWPLLRPGLAGICE